MTIHAMTSQAVGEIIAARTGTPPANLQLERKRFGGAEATETAVVTARYLDGRNRPAMLRVVVKHLEGRPAREAAVYRNLVAEHAAEMAPELLHVRMLGPDSALMFLEAVRRINAWPWRDPAAAGGMLAQLGRFHAAVGESNIALPEWNFEKEIASMAHGAEWMLDEHRKNPELAELTRDLRKVGRVAEAMPRLRRQLLAEKPFGCRPIHGDVHPGNALVRRRRGRHEPVLIDWGRARLGSPLEDLSNWLQSLHFWEAEAQRLHDTYFSRYLSAFGMPRRLTADIRAAYWIAGASNALAGALLHHLVIVADPQQRKADRTTSFQAARHWLRVIRRANAWTT